LKMSLSIPPPNVLTTGWLQTTISSGSGYDNGRTVTPSFTIDFGGQVRQTDPRQLYTLTGTPRSDVLYDYGNGRVFITAYILPEQENTTTNIVWVPALARLQQSV